MGVNVAYILHEDLKGDIPDQFLMEALDDDEDGVADAGIFDQIESRARERIDGILGQRFTVPFTGPLPPIVKSSARILVLSALYKRRGLIEEKNPWAKEEVAVLKKLDAIASGEQALTPDKQRAKPSASVITERAKTHSPAGNLMV